MLKQEKKIKASGKAAAAYINIEGMPIKYILLFLFIFSFGIRALYVNAGLFQYDSVKTAQAVERSFEAAALKGPGYARYGSLIINLIFYAPYRLIFGTKSAEKPVLWSEVFFGGLAVAAFFLLLRQIFKSNKTAVFSSIIFSVSPIFLSATTMGKEHGAEVFFILISFYLLLRFHENKTRLSLVVSSTSIVFAILVRESALVYLPFYFLLYIKPDIFLRRGLPFIENVSIKQPVFNAKSLLCMLGPFIVFLASGFSAVLANAIRLYTFTHNTAMVYGFAGFSFPFLHLALKHLYFNTGAFGILSAIAGGIILFRKNENKFYLFFLVLILLTFFIFASNRVYRARHMIVCSMPLFIFIGLFLEFVFKRSKLISLSLLLFMSASLFLRMLPIIDFRHVYSGEKEYALWLKTEVPPGSVIICMDESVFIEYYAKLKPMRHPVNAQEALQNWIQQVKKLVSAGTPVYIIEDAFAYDLDNSFTRSILKNFDLVLVGSHPKEDYHRADVKLVLYSGRLFKLFSKRV